MDENTTRILDEDVVGVAAAAAVGDADDADGEASRDDAFGDDDHDAAHP